MQDIIKLEIKRIPARRSRRAFAEASEPICRIDRHRVIFMSETYLITAKTVEEAIAIANREYADETHEISYEIIDMPKKGFLGIGAKDAKIKVTVEKSVSAELSSLVSDIQGMKSKTTRGGEDFRDNRRNSSSEKNRPTDKQKNQEKQKNPEGQKNSDKQRKPEGPKNPEKQRDSEGQKVRPEQNAAKQKADNKPRKENNPRSNENRNVQKETSLGTGTNAKPGAVHDEKKDRKSEIKENKAETKSEAKNEAKSENAANAKPVQSGYGRLGNQAKPNKRAPQVKSAGEESVEGSSVTVSSPIGLSDFHASAENSGASYKSGRMNNDIKKKTAAASSPAPSENPNVSENSNVKEEERRTEKKPLSPAVEIKDPAEIVAAAGFNADSENSAPETESAAKETKEIEAVSEDEMRYALEFANTLIANMNLPAKAVAVPCPDGVELKVTENANVYPKIEIVGDETGILIGHHGETLDAIQYLVNLSALRRSKQSEGDYVKIVVDVENYRRKREDTLRALAKRMAARAVKYKRNVFLEPMNAYERRIIHSELQSYENVSTHSVGSDKDRKIIITYEGEDKQSDSRRRRTKSGRDGKGKQNMGRPASMNDTMTATAEDVEEAMNESKRKSAERKKPQKISIEKLPEFLEARESDPSEPS